MKKTYIRLSLFTYPTLEYELYPYSYLEKTKLG